MALTIAFGITTSNPAGAVAHLIDLRKARAGMHSMHSPGTNNQSTAFLRDCQGIFGRTSTVATTSAIPADMISSEFSDSPISTTV